MVLGWGISFVDNTKKSTIDTIGIGYVTGL